MGIFTLWWVHGSEKSNCNNSRALLRYITSIPYLYRARGYPKFDCCCWYLNRVWLEKKNGSFKLGVNELFWIEPMHFFLSLGTNILLYSRILFFQINWVWKIESSEIASLVLSSDWFVFFQLLLLYDSLLHNFKSHLKYILSFHLLIYKYMLFKKF